MEKFMNKEEIKVALEKLALESGYYERLVYAWKQCNIYEAVVTELEKEGMRDERDIVVFMECW